MVMDRVAAWFVARMSMPRVFRSIMEATQAPGESSAATKHSAATPVSTAGIVVGLGLALVFVFFRIRWHKPARSVDSFGIFRKNAITEVLKPAMRFIDDRFCIIFAVAVWRRKEAE